MLPHWKIIAMGDNACYRKGALWKTRTKLKATLDTASKIDAELTAKTTIPHGEMIMVLFYEMNIGYEENIAFLWRDRVYFAFKIDTGFTFDLNPDGVNTIIDNA